MYIYTPRTFNLPTLDGISEDQVKVHLGLYEGYVKHVNLIAEKLAGVRMGDLTLDPYMVNEIRRRFAFEFDGMRMHEYYFEQLEGGPSSLRADHTLAHMLGEKYGSVDGFMSHLREVTGTRGIGWVVLYYDQVAQTVHTTFVSNHEVGQLSGLPILFALDLWEHAFMVDYVPGEKKNYVEAFLRNMNWSIVEKRFEQTQNSTTLH